ncbi:MAG TPA: glycerophosphodiester phosphodiesterase family protein [Allosphingosinicella sp.]
MIRPESIGILLAGLAAGLAQPAASRAGPPPPAPTILSHRGYAGTWPANTVEAFADAVAQGFAGFEMDVRFTIDHVPVVSHDDRLHAATDCGPLRVASIMAWQLRRCTVLYSPLIPERRVGARRAARPAALPTVRTVLAGFLAQTRVRHVVLDLKTRVGPAEIQALREALPCAPAVCAPLLDKLTFITLHEEDAKGLDAAFPDAHVAIESDETVSGLIDSFAEGADFWAPGRPYDTLSISFGSIDNPALRLIKLGKFENQHPGRRFDRLYRCNLAAATPKRLLVWTVNNRRGIRRVARYRPDLVLTDLSLAKFAERLAAAAQSHPPESAHGPPGNSACVYPRLGTPPAWTGTSDEVAEEAGQSLRAGARGLRARRDPDRGLRPEPDRYAARRAAGTARFVGYPQPFALSP